MKKIAIIIGAGASATVGIPTMPTFIKKAQEIPNDDFTEKDQKALNTLNSVLKMLNDPDIVELTGMDKFRIHNIEHILLALECENIRNHPDFPDKSLEAVKQVIAKTIELSGKLNGQHNIYDVEFDSSENQYTELVDLLLKLGEQHEISIIDFNYDLCLEFEFYQAIKCAGRRGRRRPGRKPIYEWPQFDYYLDENPNPAKLALLKMHGSLNWYVKDDEVRHIPPDDIFHDFLYDPKFSRLYIPVMNYAQKQNIDSTPFIIPPIKDKQPPNNQLSKIHATAKHRLSEAEHIIVIGYSLPDTDTHAKDLIKEARKNALPAKSISILDIDSAVEDRFRNIFMLEQGVLKFHKGGFSDFPSVARELFSEELTETTEGILNLEDSPWS